MSAKKQKQRQRQARRKKSKHPAKGKMSELISQMAGDFLRASDTMTELQNRLQAVCNAWNMACASPDGRKRQLAEYGRIFRKSNPGMSGTDVANIVKDLETLIQRKLEMFPDDRRQIIDARVVKVGSEHRIEVASTRWK